MNLSKTGLGHQSPQQDYGGEQLIGQAKLDYARFSQAETKNTAKYLLTFSYGQLKFSCANVAALC